MASDETKRIKELLREREQGDGNMDWMYKKSKPDAEEYLLGRKIDKALEEEDEPVENKNDPGAIFTDRVKANIAMDMAAKMREDPLFQIKKREEEAKKKLLQNPVRMKQLQKLVQEKEKKHKKKKKKLKKKKSKSSEDESDAGDDIMKKYLAVLSKKHKPLSVETSGGEKQKHRHRGDNHDGNEGRRHRQKSKSSSPEKVNRKSRQYRTRKDSSSPEDRQRVKKPYGLLLRGEESKRKADHDSHRKHSSNSVSPKKSRSPRRRSRSSEGERSPVRRRSPKRKHSPVKRRSPHTYRSPKRNKSKSPKRNTSRSHRSNRSRSPLEKRSRRRSRSRSPAEKASKRKLTAEEKQRKLEEMQENAKWRDDQRVKNVSRYRKEAEDEERSHLSKGSSSDFLNPLMAGHVSQSSVQDRIKRNIYNVQRTKADLDKDFTQR